MHARRASEAAICRACRRARWRRTRRWRARRRAGAECAAGWRGLREGGRRQNNCAPKNCAPTSCARRRRWRTDLRVNVVHVVLEAILGDVGLHPEVAAARALVPVDPKPADELAALEELAAGQQQQPAVARRQVLDRLQREDAEVAVGAELLPAVLGAEGVGAVLDHHRPEAEALVAHLAHARDAVEVDGRAAPVHEHDHLRRRRELRLEVVEAHVRRRRVGIDPLDPQPVGEDRPVRRGARERAREHLVLVLVEPGPLAVGPPQQVEREVEARRRRVEREHVRRAEVAAQPLLELLDARALRDVARVQGRRELLVELRRRRHEDLEEWDWRLGRRVGGAGGGHGKFVR